MFRSFVCKVSNALITKTHKTRVHTATQLEMRKLVTSSVRARESSPTFYTDLTVRVKRLDWTVLGAVGSCPLRAYAFIQIMHRMYEFYVSVFGRARYIKILCTCFLPALRLDQSNLQGPSSRNGPDVWSWPENWSWIRPHQTGLLACLDVTEIRKIY